MSEKQIDVADMQCWIFRMAQKKWKLAPTECIKLFERYGLFDFISDCYDVLHLSSYECALKDLEELLENQGVKVC